MNNGFVSIVVRVAILGGFVSGGNCPYGMSWMHFNQLPWPATIHLLEIFPQLHDRNSSEAQETSHSKHDPPALSQPEACAHIWMGVDGAPLPFQTQDQIEYALRNAVVISMKKLNIGVAGVRKVVLEIDGTRLHAAFRDVDIYSPLWTDKRKSRLSFRDCCLFECAAYELSKMLGMKNVPPVVLRRIEGTMGTLQIWVENTMMEKERLKRKISAPDKALWNGQLLGMKVFDSLIFNDDRNQGNILIDENWKVWLIDHTRAFRPISSLPDPKTVQYCSREMWDRLKKLEENEIKSSLENFIRQNELEALFRRKSDLISHIQNLINEKGEHMVIFDHQP